jgi:hypothetical protein
MTRNEERDIVEWALFHAWTGFDSIIIFENRSTDRTRERLDALKNIIDIRIFDWQYEYHPGHYLAFQTCVEQFRDDYMHAHSSIGVNWAMFGSSGHVDYPKELVTRAFLDRAPLGLSANRHVKSLVRPKDMVGCTNSHTMDMREGIPTVDSHGNPIEWLKRGKMGQAVGLDDMARFHHYFVRSRAHWEKRMAIPYNAAKRSQQRFEDYDINEVHDPIIVEKWGDVLERIDKVRYEIIDHF